MGLSNLLGSAGLKGMSEQVGGSVGDRVGDYFKDKFPIASGIAGATGLGGNRNTPPLNPAPFPDLTTNDQASLPSYGVDSMVGVKRLPNTNAGSTFLKAVLGL